MSLVERVAATIRNEGWTCEAHEPDPDCEVCRPILLRTAQAVLEALGFVTCQTCDGEGNYPPLTRQVCPTCHGRKVVPSDEMTELVAIGIAEADTGIDDYQALAEAAVAALLAAIGGDE